MLSPGWRWVFAGGGYDEDDGAELNLCATNLIVHRLAAGGYGRGGFPGDVHM